jgi:hypothetical protein
MGRAAAELLLSMIDQNLHREEVSDVVLAPALVVCRSTPPRRRPARPSRRGRPGGRGRRRRRRRRWSR